MRMRFEWVLPALFVLLCLPLPPVAAAEAKKPEAKDEPFTPSPKLRYHLLSDIAESEPNDSPATATLLGCGNTLRPAAIAVQAVRDTDWISFTANAGDMITFGTNADGLTPVGDTRIGIFRNDGVTEIGEGDDDSGPVRYSLYTICAPYTGTYYGRIAAFGSETGTYMAFVSCAPSGVPNDQCAGAIKIPCGVIELSGTTADACPDYTLPEAGCTGFLANGRDVVYKVEAVAGDSIYLDYVQTDPPGTTPAADASIYLVTDCADPAGTCLAGSDSTLGGGHEVLAHKFAADGTYYIVLDSFSPGSGGPWTANGVFLCVPDQIDTLASAHADLDLKGPWGAETVALNGSVTLGATLHALSGIFGPDQVPVELQQLELTGNSLNAGPVTLRLRPAAAHPFQPSGGVIREQVNSTPGVLDVPPFTPVGAANMQLTTYLELEMPVLKLLLHNHVSKQFVGPLTHVPPGAGDSLAAAFDHPLVDANESPTAYQLGPITLTPNPAVATDSLANPRMTLDLLGPFGLDTVMLKGTTVVRTRLGNLGDTEGNGLEQVGIEVAAMNLSGVSLLYGPILASLEAPAPHVLPATTGKVEENVNAQTARLDLPPFAPSGTAASDFDLYFRMEIAGVRYHNHVAKHMTATLSQLPPAPGEQYRNFVPTPLLGEADAASPYQVRRMFFMPFEVKPDSTQQDSFPASRLAVDVMGPWGYDELVMTGMTRTETYLGTVQDGDDDGLEQMGTRLVDLAFTSPGGVYGHIPGPVTLVLRDTLGLGEIEESANYTPSTLDLPPFTPVGGAAGTFFEVLFEMEIPGYPTLRNMKPSLLEATLRRVPVENGDTYFGPGDNPLVDLDQLPSGMTIVALRLTPLAGGPVGVPESAPLPSALAIQEIRPNPTSGSAAVTLALPRAASASLAAYDVNGRRVRTLWNGAMEAGVRTLTWDGTSDRGVRVPGGVYFIRFESESERSVKRLAILR